MFFLTYTYTYAMYTQCLLRATCMFHHKPYTVHIHTLTPKLMCLFHQKPVEKSFGEEMYELRGSGSKRCRVLTSDTFYYVPLGESLKQFMSHPDVAVEISKSHKSPDGVMRDFCDGTACMNHVL